MDSKGFYRYKGLESVEYITPQSVSVPETPCDKYETLLNMIFAKDVDGWPSGAFSQFMSEKTASEVRQFIQDYLLSGGHESTMDLPSDVLNAYKDLPSDFVAQASRNRYESVEQYETRVSELISQMRAEEGFKQRYEAYMKSSKKE